MFFLETQFPIWRKFEKVVEMELVKTKHIIFWKIVR